MLYEEDLRILVSMSLREYRFLEDFKSSVSIMLLTEDSSELDRYDSLDLTGSSSSKG